MHRLFLLLAVVALGTAQTGALEGIIDGRNLIVRVPGHDLSPDMRAVLQIETHQPREVAGQGSGDYLLYRVQLNNEASSLKLKLTAVTADGKNVTFTGTATKGTQPATWTPAHVTLQGTPQFEQPRPVRVRLAILSDRDGQVIITTANADGSSAGPEQRFQVASGNNLVYVNAEPGQTVTALDENRQPVAKPIAVLSGTPEGKSGSVFWLGMLAGLALFAALAAAGLAAVFVRRLHDRIDRSTNALNARIGTLGDAFRQELQQQERRVAESVAAQRAPAAAPRDSGRSEFAEKIRQLEQRIGGPFQRQPGPARPPALTPQTDAKVLAVVNEWLRRGGRNIDELRDLAARIGLRITLCAHREVTRSISDLTYMKYHLPVTNSDPAWVLCSAPEAGRYFAVPFFSQQFRSSNALEFLSRLYEIPEPVPSSALTIRKVYRACVLEASEPDVYRLSAKGLLQLDGQQAPEADEPADLARLLPSPLPAVPAPESLSSALHAAFDAIARLERDYGSRTSPPPVSPVIQQQIDTLRVSVENLRSDLQSRAAADSVVRIEQNAAKLQAEIGRALQEIQTVRAAIDDEAQKSAATRGPAFEEPVRHVEEAHTPVEQESVSEVRTAAAAAFQSGVDPYRAPAVEVQARATVPESPAWSLPPEWREALKEASSSTAFGRPVDALLASLSPRLKNTGLAAAVVQMSVGRDERCIRLASDSTPDDRHVAVAVGPRGDNDGRVAILLPPGPIPASSYFQLYKKLIPDIQNWTPPYQIGHVEEPAYLVLIENGLYEVRSPMRCSQ